MAAHVGGVQPLVVRGDVRHRGAHGGGSSRESQDGLSDSLRAPGDGAASERAGRAGRVPGHLLQARWYVCRLRGRFLSGILCSRYEDLGS